MQELVLEEGDDTLAKWMAHYIAEQIVRAEKSEGDEKSDAEKACFDTILKLWSHRSSLPNGKRPFESFESIFRAIESFDPENEHPRFFVRLEDEQKTNKQKRKKQDDRTSEWIDIAKVTDEAARVIIQYSFKQAALNAVDNKIRKWLSESICKIYSDESAAIFRIILATKNTTGERKEQIEVQQNIDAIQSKIDILDAFRETGEFLRTALDADLQEQLRLKSLSDTDQPIKSAGKRKPRKKGKILPTHD